MASPRKSSSFSWDRSGVRVIQFKAMKAGEKIGFGLGGDGQRQEIVSVKEGTQSYWKGVKKGYIIVSVNGVKVDAITVKSAVKEACASGMKFNIGMSTGAPAAGTAKRSSKARSSRTSYAAKKKRASKTTKKRTAVDELKEEVVEGYKDEKPIIDNGTFFYQDEVDVGGWFAGDNEESDYVPIERR